jgi:hypothetical protein
MILDAGRLELVDGFYPILPFLLPQPLFKPYPN